MNKLETAFERLRAEGWYCAWGLPCCQTCAWDEVSCEDDIDLEKVLFNHEQDIEEEHIAGRGHHLRARAGASAS